MCVLAFLIISLIISGQGITTGSAFSDVERCIHRAADELDGVKNQYCMVKKNDVHLFCPEHTIIVLSSLQFAIKNTSVSRDCNRRILTPGNYFCCNVEDKDILYDGDCLQDVWNVEDKQYYLQFMHEALRKCKNTSHCILNSQMFRTLQKEIPTTRKYSSYFQIIHQCVTAPTDLVKVCSSKSVKGKEIHVQGNFTAKANPNKTCTCRVTSESNGEVTVRAVDVRTANSGLVLRSNGNVKDISKDQLPLFGFREIFTDRNLHLSLKNKTANAADNLWLHVSGSNGQEVKVTCGNQSYIARYSPPETTPPVPTTPQPVHVHGQGPVSHGHPEVVFGGLWPVIYVGSGSLITLFLIACILGTYLWCKNSIKKKKRRNPHQHCGHACLHSRTYYQQGPYGIPYATVLDDVSHLPVPDTNIYRSPSSHKSLEWANFKPHQQKSAEQGTMLTRKFNQPMAPIPPLLVPGKRLEDNTNSSLISMTPGTSSDVSELGSLLELKTPNPADRPPVPVPVQVHAPSTSRAHDNTQPHASRVGSLMELRTPNQNEASPVPSTSRAPDNIQPIASHARVGSERHDSGFIDGANNTPMSPFRFDSRSDDDSSYFVLEKRGTSSSTASSTNTR